MEKFLREELSEKGERGCVSVCKRCRGVKDDCTLIFIIDVIDKPQISLISSVLGELVRRVEGGGRLKAVELLI